MSGQNDNNDSAAPSATTPLLPRDEPETKIELSELKAPSEAQAPPSPAKEVAVAVESQPNDEKHKQDEQQADGNDLSAIVPSNEYRFVQQRFPPRQGKLRFVLPALVLSFQVVFIILFALFGHYSVSSKQSGLSEHDSRKYTMFGDLHAIALLGFGFLMTFLKRYGYGSVGFNLVLVAFAIQWALLIRGWIECDGSSHNGSFKVGIDSLVNADFTAVAVLVTFGALLGKTTLSQLIVVALVEVVVQVANEFLNVQVIKAYDSGRSVYVHVFGAVFGLAVSKALNFKGVQSYKQASVYHSDLFSLIGALFLWVYYPSFNGLLAKNAVADGQTKAIVNTVAALSASCVVTFGVSSLAGKGKISPLHVQHATIAGGIAIGSVADLNVQIYVALIAGAVAGLLSTIGYQYIDGFLRNCLKLHDTCSVLSLHAIPGLISGLLGIIFAACSSYAEYDQALYEIYPARLPQLNSTEFFEQNIKLTNGLGRSGGEQAAYQIAALVITIGLALAAGILVGLFLRLPIFEKLSEDPEMFDDEAQWVTPDDYALKLTLSTTTNQISKAAAEPAPQQSSDNKDISSV